MIRTQIYLTSDERAALRLLAERTGRKQSELIREAIDRLIEDTHESNRLHRLEAGRGLWKGRTELDDFRQHGRETDRAGLARS